MITDKPNIKSVRWPLMGGLLTVALGTAGIEGSVECRPAVARFFAVPIKLTTHASLGNDPITVHNALCCRHVAGT